MARPMQQQKLISKEKLKKLKKQQQDKRHNQD
jgi:hypothetical protein